jgi:segregation and condensation protein A
MTIHHATGTLPDSWRVSLPVFEGPLDLLLTLVRAEELEVGDIPLALMEELDLDIAGEFVYEAAQLIALKARLLLPRKTDDEGRPVDDDPRQGLVQRLLEYRRIKEAAQALAEVHGVRRGIWTRQARDLQAVTANDDQEEIGLEEVSLYDLMRALNGVLDRYGREHPDPYQLRGEVFSVRDQLLRLVKRMEGGRPFDVVDDLRGRSCRGEAIAAFLAVLEMAKLGLVRLHQTAGGAVLLYRTARELDMTELEGIQG